jgi:hypothetical protein
VCDGRISNTFFRVSVWVGFIFILLPLGDHLGPFQNEVHGENGVELLGDVSVLGLHGLGLK